MVEHRPDKAKAESSILSIPTNESGYKIITGDFKFLEDGMPEQTMLSGCLKGVPVHLAGVGDTIVPPEMITVPITYLSEGKLHSWRFMGGRWVITKGA